MAVVATVAADLAALRETLPNLPNPGLVVMILVLEVGLFRCASRRGEAGAFWVGFQISGWLYVLAASTFAQAAWRLARDLFERHLLGRRPIGAQSEWYQFLLFAGGLQFAIGLAVALTFGLLGRAAWRRACPRAGVGGRVNRPPGGGSSCGS